MLLNDPGPLLHHGEVLWRNGAWMGEICAASYDHTPGGAVGLCMAETNEQVNKASATVASGGWRLGTRCILVRSPSGLSMTQRIVR